MENYLQKRLVYVMFSYKVKCLLCRNIGKRSSVPSLIVSLSFSFTVSGRPGNSSLRLGQIQAAEKNEDVNNTIPDDKEKALHKSRARHGKVVLATDARKYCEESNSESLNLGFDLVRCILQSIQNDQRNRTLTFSCRFASGKKDEDSNPFHGEIRSVSETENSCSKSQTHVFV